ncbi:phosphatidic acid phosphatase [Actinokineospora sp. PR83]|uniref:phosphatidic acid phosphatase n=1 Tax=Actinokineospora sp. PR83 TaxID=2884908 RepID=UPI001F1D2575|nr:phosphatidic acid phosphatase [Actinokineospora sp. PR83]MCG8919335.1 phosphatidic acid phosphatase [Actinokineospora sp. PR83]
MERDRLLPRPLRGPAAAVAAVCFAAVLALGLPVAGQADAGAADAAVTGAVDRVFAGVPGVLEPLSYSTHPAAMVGLMVVLVVIALRLRRPRVALLAVAGPVLTAAVNTWVLKPLFDRTHDDYLAYPSGHTGTLVSILAVITLVGAGSAPAGTRLRTALLSGAAGLVLTAVAASAIVGLAYHYPSDTVGALFWAVGAVVVVAAGIDRLPVPPGSADRRPDGPAGSVAAGRHPKWRGDHRVAP